MDSHQPITTGLLSYGMSGEIFHAPLLAVHPGFRLKAVLQRKSDSSKEHYPDINVVRNLENILADPHIDLVVVNTPNETHFDFTVKVLEAGIPVFS